jgi:hypothetical protein
VIELTPHRTGSSPALVTLVRGDVRELGAVAAAARLAEPLRAGLVGAVMPGRPRAAFELLRVLTADCVGQWYAWSDLAGEAARGEVRGVVVAVETWRAAPRAVWAVLERCPLLIQRRQPAALPRRILVAVDSRATLEALTGAVERLPGQPDLSVTVAYASVPAWACSMSAATGCPVMVGQPERDEFPWPLPHGETGVCLQSTPQWAIRSLVEELRPDLVVLGMHAHRLRVPWLTHPIAWRLSRELPTDVLLWPVGRPSPAG